MTNTPDFEAVPPREVGPDTGHHPHHHHVIRFWLDGEEYETHRHEITPDEIIRDFGRLDLRRTISWRSGGHTK